MNITIIVYDLSSLASILVNKLHACNQLPEFEISNPWSHTHVQQAWQHTCTCHVQGILHP